MRSTGATACICALQLTLSGVSAAGQDSDGARLGVGSDGWYSWRVAARELIAVIEKPGLDMELRRAALFSLAHTDSELVIPWFSDLLASR